MVVYGTWNFQTENEFDSGRAGLMKWLDIYANCESNDGEAAQVTQQTLQFELFGETFNPFGFVDQPAASSDRPLGKSVKPSNGLFLKTSTIRPAQSATRRLRAGSGVQRAWSN